MQVSSAENEDNEQKTKDQIAKIIFNLWHLGYVKLLISLDARLVNTSTNLTLHLNRCLDIAAISHFATARGDCNHDDTIIGLYPFFLYTG